MKQNIFYSPSRSFSARIKRSLSAITHSVYIDLKADERRTVLLSGAPRSGTTWLAEIFNSSDDCRLLYEPFNHDHVPACSHFAERQYLRPDDNDPRYVVPAHAVFTGRIRNRWIDQYNRPTITRRRLVKDVRSTLMLKWVRNHFPGMKIIFIVRHPCAVAVSRMKLGWRPIWRKTFFDQPDLMTDHLEPFREAIEDAQSAFQRHMVDWCIETFIPFAQLSSEDVYLLFYEDLCANPESELRALFEFLGWPISGTALRRAKRPSITTRVKGERSAVLAGESLVDAWRKDVTDDEFNYARRTTSLFGLDQIYDGNSVPDTRSARDLLRKSPVPLLGSVSGAVILP